MTGAKARKMMHEINARLQHSMMIGYFFINGIVSMSAYTIVS